MHLTLFTDYALRALIYLGLRPQQRSSIAEIGLAFSVAENHMAKIAHALGQAGLVKTTRGRNGGLQLAHPAGDIRLGDVVRQMEPNLGLVVCQSGGTCAVGGICDLEHVMDEAREAMLAVLDRYTLADILASRHAALRRRLGLPAAAN